MEWYGKRITEARQARGMDRKQVARRVGIDGNALRQWEGEYRPDIPAQVAYDLCRVLEFPVRFFTRPPTDELKGPMWFCYSDGEAPPGTYCRFCGNFAEVECDWPVGGGVTCDLPLCLDHRTHILDGPDPDGEYDIDYCPAHAHLAARSQ